ncbi:MAG: hypothetical protein SFU53_14710 [Terrimicrobiaceae bacterium]|nr:hypothetical protein [Terrimicrobiaceae bacterium]
MARRRKSSIQPLWFIVAAVLILAAIVGARFFPAGVSDPYRTVPELDVAAYLENANSLRGNVYKVEGEVANALAWSPESGRLISVDVDEGRNTIPVLVTPEFNAMNIQRGQRLIFVMEVDERGILVSRKVTQV